MATVKGKLYNQQLKEEVAFANIYISDADGTPLSPQRGTQSDIDGTFKLDNILPENYVAISYIGLPKHVVKVSSLPKDNRGNYTLNKTYSSSEITIPVTEIVAERIKKKDEKKSRKGLFIGLGVGLGVLAIAGTVWYFKTR